MEDFMPDHKFKIGQSVQFTSGPFGRGAATGIYKVTQLMPPEGDETSTGSRAPTSRMSGWSRKVRWIASPDAICALNF